MARASTSSFGSPVWLTTERSQVANVAIGDFDGDGRQDLAVTAHSRDWVHELRVYFQDAQGRLSAPVTVPFIADPNGLYGVIAVDLDKDGAAEAVVSDLGGIRIVRWGSTRAPVVTTHRVPTTGCVFLATGDLDGDGHPDVACHNRNNWPNAISVFFGDGQGGVRAQQSVQSPAVSGGHDFKTLQIGDVTGDGRPDLVVTASSSPVFHVFPNDGNGGFLPAVEYAHPPAPSQGWPASLLLLDIDGDGANEVITANTEDEPHARLYIYRSGADGRLTLAAQQPIHSSTTALLAGDVGGDGDRDLVLGHWAYGAVSVLGDHDAGWQSQRRYELPGFGNDVAYALRYGHTNALALGDLDGDGCNDLAAATYSGIKLLYGCRPYATRMPVSDFDGDGVSDLFWRQAALPGFMDLWLWAAPRTSYDCPLPCPPYVDSEWNGQVTGDFDGDGATDIFWRSPRTGENHISLKGFYLRRGLTVADQDWQVVGAGDFDGDDRSDLLWRNRRTGDNVVWHSGVYTGARLEATVADQQWQVATIGDFDGDGRDDILWRHASTGRNNMWWGGRSGGVAELVQVGNLDWHLVGNGDFNGDGRSDLVWRNKATGEGILWYSADPHTQGGLVTVADQQWQIAAVGDYNGDAVSDLLWRHATTGANVIWWSGNAHYQRELARRDPSYRLCADPCPSPLAGP